MCVASRRVQLHGAAMNPRWEGRRLPPPPLPAAPVATRFLSTWGSVSAIQTQTPIHPLRLQWAAPTLRPAWPAPPPASTAADQGGNGRTSGTSAVAPAPQLRQEPDPQPGRVDWRRQWYAVAMADDVDSSRPYAVTVLGTPLCIWRDSAGAWRCFEDRCPHRGVPLSGARRLPVARRGCFGSGGTWATPDNMRI